MGANFLNNIAETLDKLGKFLFESYTGITILVCSCLLITFIIAVLLEIKTKKQFKNHPEESAEEENNDE